MLIMRHAQFQLEVNNCSPEGSFDQINCLAYAAK